MVLAARVTALRYDVASDRGTGGGEFFHLRHISFSTALLKGWVMQRKIFWIIFLLLGLLADFLLSLWWAFAATIPIGAIAWWVAYRSDWF
jgi:hypothetical protein